MRLVRGPGREGPRRGARCRDGERQLPRPLGRRCGSTRTSSGRRWSPGRCSLRRSATSATACRTRGRVSTHRRSPVRAPATGARGGADAAAARRVDGRPLALRRLGVVGARVLDARRLVGGLDVPPGDDREPSPRCGHDGHARVGRHDRGLDVVVGGRARRPRGEHVLRDGGGDHHVDPARPLSGGPREGPHRTAPCRTLLAFGAKRPASRTVTRSRSRASSSATGSSSGRARRSRPTESSSTGRARSTCRC